MKNKICIITGASSGMGLATAVSLAGMGANLGLVCRNKLKGESVVKNIIEKTRNNKIELFIADLSSLKEIKNLASAIQAKFPRIDVLINNAGAINPDRIVTVDGYETTFAVNHLAYFCLTNLLLDHLKVSPKARIVNVASQAAMIGKIDLNDLQLEKKYSPTKAYANSKLANIMFTYELARKIEGSNITANCLHPGGVRTNFGKDLKGIAGFIFKKFGGLMRTAEKGAETIIWLASSQEVQKISGKYFKDKKEIKSPKLSYDQQMQKDLWDVSNKLCGLK